MKSLNTRVTIGFAALLLVIGFAGCSSRSRSPPTYPVTGTLTWNGEPLEGASIVLIPVKPGGDSASGVSGTDGSFSLTTYFANDGAPAGKYRVKIFKYETPPRSAQEDPSKGEEQANDKGEKQLLPVPKNLLPKQYENEATSGIEHTVTELPTTLDIDVK